jgi:sporulation protein YlmC with PRC-barrel domain
MRISDQDLRGRTVIGADGRAIGEVAGLTLDTIDSDRPSLATLQVALRREMEDALGIEHRRFRPATIEIPFANVQSIGDAVVLSIPVDGLPSLLRPTEPAASPPPP